MQRGSGRGRILIPVCALSCSYGVRLIGRLARHENQDRSTRGATRDGSVGNAPRKEGSSLSPPRAHPLSLDPRTSKMKRNTDQSACPRGDLVGHRLTKLSKPATSPGAQREAAKAPEGIATSPSHGMFFFLSRQALGESKRSLAHSTRPDRSSCSQQATRRPEAASLAKQRPRSVVPAVQYFPCAVTSGGPKRKGIHLGGAPTKANDGMVDHWRARAAQRLTGGA